MKLRQSWIWTPIAVIGVAAGSYALFVALQPPELPAGFLYGNGHVEGTEVSVAAEVTGRVIESKLIEGRAVENGDVLVRLDDADLRKRLAQAEAGLAAARDQLASAESRLKTARHHVATAETDLGRDRKLRAAGVITPERLGQREDTYAAARGDVQALEKQLAQSKEQLEALRQEADLARLQLERTVVRAPIGGTVLVKAIEPGELATPGRVVAVLVDLSRLELKVYVPEGDIGAVKLGDPARVRVDAFPDRYFEAAVARIDQRAQFTPRDIHTPEERVRMVFGVTLALANPARYLKPGMPADAWIRADAEATWPERLVVPR